MMYFTMEFGLISTTVKNKTSIASWLKTTTTQGRTQADEGGGSEFLDQVVSAATSW